MGGYFIGELMVQSFLFGGGVTTFAWSVALLSRVKSATVWGRTAAAVSWIVLLGWLVPFMSFYYPGSVTIQKVMFFLTAAAGSAWLVMRLKWNTLSPGFRGVARFMGFLFPFWVAMLAFICLADPRYSSTVSGCAGIGVVYAIFAGALWHVFFLPVTAHIWGKCQASGEPNLFQTGSLLSFFLSALYVIFFASFLVL